MDVFKLYNFMSWHTCIPTKPSHQSIKNMLLHPAPPYTFPLLNPSLLIPACFIFYFCRLHEIFYSFFSPFLDASPFSCLIVLARTCSTRLSGNGKNRRPWLATSLQRETFILSPVSMKLAAGFYRWPLVGLASSFLFLVW